MVIHSTFTLLDETLVLSYIKKLLVSRSILDMKLPKKLYKVIHIYMVHHYVASNYGWNVCKLEESVFEVHNYNFYSNILSTYYLKSKLKK